MTRPRRSIPGSVAVLLPYFLLSLDWEWARLDLGPFRYLGLPLMAVGAVTYLPCLWEFVARGLGTPSPLDPPQKLVTTGLYRFVRNPMYVTVGTFLIGEAVFFESLLLALFFFFFWLDVHLFILLYEEPTLRRMFGEEYEAYCRRVHRWTPTLGRAARTDPD